MEGELSGDVRVPKKIGGYIPTALQNGALSGQNAITSLTLTGDIYAVQSGALSQMENLQTLTLNDELQVICRGNISRLPALTSLTIPANVRLIESGISQCDNLTEIRFLGECPIFMDTAFCFWWMPDEYTIYVPDDQFDAYAEALKDANGAADHLKPSGQNALPHTQTKDSWFAFDAATGTITEYNEYYAFVEFPQSIGGVPVKTIADEAMQYDTSIYAITLPEGVETVGNAAFDEVTNLMYVELPSTLKTIGDSAFSKIDGTEILWSEGLETIGTRAFEDIRTKTLTLPGTVKTIGESAFESSWIEELHLGSAVEHIGARAFADSKLMYMAFDLHAPIDIAADAFTGNPLADLDLPWDSTFENQTAYADLLRGQCPDLTVWINNPVAGGVAENPVYDETICMFENGVWTMYKGNQPDLTPWTWYDDIQVTALGDGVFKGNQTIRSFYPHHCGWFTTIGNEAFADSTIEYVELFGSITTIGNGAFRNCLHIKELTLPASLTSIGADALSGCDNLQKLIVLCDPAILPDGLLDECFAHTEIFAAPDATDEQVRILSEKAHRPWYAPVSRVGEEANDLIQMPYAMFLIDDFWYDTEYARLDRYHGYELNLYLPREAEGITLTAIGGDLMGRARAGDNYDMELPVRSLVIPENYTEIPTLAFYDCTTLETVICYAPLEKLPDSLFDGCTNLREVVFVNGVRNVSTYVFNGCEKLETVYLGNHVESVSDYAFTGSNFDLSRCITDPALMPDVEALLAAVKSDPIPEPEPVVEPVAAPVGEAGAAYVGQWQADVLEMEGESYPVALMGMQMLLTLREDGVATNYDGETTEESVWYMDNGVAMLDGMALVLTEDGKLVMADDEMKLIFVRPGSGVEMPSAETGAEASGTQADFVGQWQADVLEMEGESYPVALMGMEMILTLREDGVATNYDGETTEESVWYMDNGVAMLDGMALVLTEDGKLVMADDEMKLIFVRPGSGVEMPSAESGEEVSGTQADFVGQWQADVLEMEGESYPVALMGMEMILTLREDGVATNYDGETTEESVWYMDNGMAMLDGIALTLTEDGKLVMADEEMKLIFVRLGSGVEMPSAETFPETGAEATVADASAESSMPALLMDVRYAAKSAETGGITMDASLIGEYTLTFHADGTADFVMVGTPVPGLSWTQADGAITIDYYTIPMAVTLTDTGFDLDYFGTMLMHFAPAE